jgi:hypothetical protein
MTPRCCEWREIVFLALGWACFVLAAYGWVLMLMIIMVIL